LASTDNDVNGNRVSDMRYGIHYMYADNNRFTGNVHRRWPARPSCSPARSP
jgi:parallel beta-helix repeat protein